jgi:hypothetical protein
MAETRSVNIVLVKTEREAKKGERRAPWKN